MSQGSARPQLSMSSRGRPSRKLRRCERPSRLSSSVAWAGSRFAATTAALLVCSRPPISPRWLAVLLHQVVDERRAQDWLLVAVVVALQLAPQLDDVGQLRTNRTE